MRLWAIIVSKSFPPTVIPCHLSTAIEFEIISDFLDPLCFEHGPKLLQNTLDLPCLAGQRHIIARMRREGKSQAQQLGRFGIKTAGLDVKTKRILTVQGFEQFGALSRESARWYSCGTSTSVFRFATTAGACSPESGADSPVSTKFPFRITFNRSLRLRPARRRAPGMVQTLDQP